MSCRSPTRLPPPRKSNSALNRAGLRPPRPTSRLSCGPALRGGQWHGYVRLLPCVLDLRRRAGVLHLRPVRHPQPRARAGGPVLSPATGCRCGRWWRCPGSSDSWCRRSSSWPIGSAPCGGSGSSRNACEPCRTSSMRFATWPFTSPSAQGSPVPARCGLPESRPGPVSFQRRGARGAASRIAPW